MQIDEKTFGAMPAHLQSLFVKLPNPGSDEVLAGFPAKAGGGDKRGACQGKRPGGFGNVGHDKGDGEPNSTVYADSGSAARFFYCAKPSKAERGEGNTHETVKPIALMRYLTRLVTPPGGVVVDNFLGSGTTMLGALEEKFKCIGIELYEKNCIIARNRVEERFPGTFK